MKYHTKSTLYMVLSVGCLVGVFWLGQWFGQRNQTVTEPNMSFVQCSPSELGFHCSMHPNFRVREQGQCPFCQMPLTKEVVLPSQDSGLIQLSEKAVALANIETQRLSRIAGTKRGIELVGKIAVDHGRKYTQVASLPGRIEALYAQRPGQWIQQGQPIARIYSKELVAAVEAFRRANTPESVKQSALNNLADWQVPLAVFQELVKAPDHRQAVDIYASASGLVSELKTHVGEQAVNTIMGAPTPLYTLVDLSVVWAELEVFESEIRQIKAGQRVKVSVDAFPNEDFSGRIISLSPQINESSRSLKAIVDIKNPQLRLRPGMLARGSVELRGPHGPALQIPRSAVLWTGKRSVVFVRETDLSVPVFSYREIELGEMHNEYYEVKSGLQEGEEIVINGTFTLDAAAQLQGKHSMLNRPKAQMDEI